MLDEGALSEATLRIGEIDRASGAAALAYVARATKLALAGEAAAVVTLPINKAATRLSAPTFTGHTEYVAELCGRTSSTLMLASERAIVTHVSTHVSLREAIELAQPARILEVIVQTDEILRRLRPTRRIAVAGLNPHAGEGGAFGDEDSGAHRAGHRQGARSGASRCRGRIRPTRSSWIWCRAASTRSSACTTTRATSR